MPGFDAGHTLGVDIGTSTTAAAVRTPDGRVRIRPISRIVDAATVLAELRPRRIRPELVLTHPAGWGPGRIDALIAAGHAAGFGAVRSLAAPLAAVAYHTAVLGRPMPFGGALVVHDLGATFDASVVVRRAQGLEVVAAEHRDLGGDAIDRSLVAYVRSSAGFASIQDQELCDAVRTAKEKLSATMSARIRVAGGAVEAEFTRGTIEHVAEPVLTASMEVTRDLLRALTPTDDPGDLLHIGGTMHVPWVRAALARARIPVSDRPDTVVAHGAAVSGSAGGAGSSGGAARRWWPFGR